MESTKPNSPTESSPRALLLCRDLFFVSKVTGTATELGFSIVTAGEASAALSIITATDIRCIFLDLATPGLNLEEFVRALPQTPRPTIVAFGAHVQTERLREAREAGCDQVLPRSKFSATLPELLNSCLGDATDLTSGRRE